MILARVRAYPIFSRGDTLFEKRAFPSRSLSEKLKPKYFLKPEYFAGETAFFEKKAVFPRTPFRQET